MVDELVICDGFVIGLIFRVEYVDVFGRTRTCHKDDLEIMQNIDKKLQKGEVS